MYGNKIGQKGAEALIDAIFHVNFTPAKLDYGLMDMSEQQEFIMDNILIDNRRARAAFRHLKSEQQSIMPYGLWAQALWHISQQNRQADFMYQILKSANPMIVREPRNRLRRFHCEAFGNDYETDSEK